MLCRGYRREMIAPTEFLGILKKTTTFTRI
nr:MAG TPA: hypothetical protein [Caudoviricetes sp.]